MKSFKNLCVLVIVGASLNGCNDSSSTTKSAKAPGSSKLASKLPFDSSLSSVLTPGGTCNFDSIDGKDRNQASYTVKRVLPLSVVGWAAVSDVELSSNVVVAFQLAGGATQYAETKKEKREDLATFFKKPVLVDAGFNALIDLSDLLPGQYTLEIIQHKNGGNFLCGITKVVNVVE